MAFNHTPPLSLPDGYGSEARWAFQPNGHLVAFVHGFNGSATKTWLDFPTYVKASDHCRNCDVIFFGYKSLRQEATKSAEELFHCLNDIFSLNLKYVNESIKSYSPSFLRDPAAFRFQKLTLIGHSLGTVIARQALVFESRSDKPWQLEKKLLLFAPAHSGANIVALAFEALVGVPYGSVGTAVVERAFPSLRDLKPGSDYLKKLSEDCRELVEKGKIHLRAKKIVVADNDAVVGRLPFNDDPPPDRPDRGTTHTSVCKPVGSYRTPIEKLEEFL